MFTQPFAIRPLPATILLAVVGTVAATSANADDLATIRQRIERPLLVAPQPSVVRRLIDTIDARGSWPDIDYSNKNRSAWPLVTHLSRVKVLAQAFRTGKDGETNSQIRTALHSGLDYWLRLDPQNPNWWWNQIGVPKALLPILLLLDNELSTAQRANGLKILQRAKMGRTGQNLVWVTEITAGRGLLERNPELVAQAYERIAHEIRVERGEGIQSDFSFHQHGPCLYSHGYGAAFIADCSRIATQVAGTKMAFSPEKIELLTHLVLDGTQWMSRGQATDFGAEGREITRKGQSPSHLVAAARCLLQLPTGREEELRMLEARATGRRQTPPLSGNRHFWRSDFMTHHRPAYYASARSHSKRLANTDGPANSEGLLSHYLADGCLVLMQDGTEFRDIFGVWDWQKIPGTTVQLKQQLTGSPRRMGTTDFVGGTSDGKYGLSAFDFERSGLVARKSWFFLDDEFICLGAGISSQSDLPVVTTLNQCLMRGDVMVSHSGRLKRLEPGNHNVSARQSDWIWHDQVAYILLQGATLTVQNTTRSGSWHTANRRYPNRNETRDIFTAWIDHGTRSKKAGYAYAVVPGMDTDQVAEYLSTRSCRIISNTSRLQAVEQKHLGLVAAVFYEPGELESESGPRIRVDQPCLLLARRSNRQITFTASNPRNTGMTIRVELSLAGLPQEQAVEIDLPDGLEAGRSVSVVQEVSLR